MKVKHASQMVVMTTAILLSSFVAANNNATGDDAAVGHAPPTTTSQQGSESSRMRVRSTLDLLNKTVLDSGILNRADVRSEIKLTEAQADALSKYFAQLPTRPQLFAEAGLDMKRLNAASEEDFVARSRKLDESLQRVAREDMRFVDELLSDVQRKRFVQLKFQFIAFERRNIGAALNSTRVGRLNPDQEKEIEKKRLAVENVAAEEAKRSRRRLLADLVRKEVAAGLADELMGEIFDFQ